MAGRSKKAKQDNPPVASHDEVASHGNEEQQSQPPSGSTMIGQKHQSFQAIILRRKSPDDINSNQSLDGDSENVNAEGPTVDQPQNTKRQKTRGTEDRASPARLFKLNKDLNFEQKGAIIEKEFGGLLDLAANSMPGDLSQWIMRHYDPEMSQIVISERGKIPVDAASVRRIWGLPNRGGSLSISPKSFPAVMDVNVITETNICQFVVDQLKLAFTLGRRNKKAVCCCVFHIVLLYLDSLDVDEPIPNLVPRVSVWNSDLISKVIKKDRKALGEYGNLRLKTKFSRSADDSLFGSVDHITKFVATRLPESYDKTKQKKLTRMVHEMCSVISHAVGELVTGFGRIDDDEWGARTPDPDDVETSRRQSKRRRQQVPASTDSLPSDEESFISDDDGSEEDHSENDEVSEDKDNDGIEEDGSSDNDDGDEVGTSVHMGREVEIDGNKDEEDEEEGKEDDDDDEGDDNKEENEDDEGDDNKEEKEDDEGDDKKEEKEDDEGDDNDEEKEDCEGDDNEEQKEDDEQGGDEDDDDDNGGNGGSGGNSGSGSNDGSGDNEGSGDNGGSGGNGGSCGTPPNVDDEQCTLQFLFEKRRHNKKKKITG
ncbi:hypothetical protein D1007_13374 [Hordeum vulgare]|nr:hypothetical protein D1007_13374 [Hordeum vulgare]